MRRISLALPGTIRQGSVGVGTAVRGSPSMLRASAGVDFPADGAASFSAQALTARKSRSARPLPVVPPLHSWPSIMLFVNRRLLSHRI